MRHRRKIKGLDLPIGGVAERKVLDARCIDRYAVKPADVVGFTPKLLVAEGDTVAAGTPLVADKHDPRLVLPSPVGGVVRSIVRGDKRRLLEVVVEQAESGEQREENSPNTELLTPSSPCWWMLRERPFGTIANPDHRPKGIFVSMFDSNPLAPDLDFAMQGRSRELMEGLAALAEWAPVHVCFRGQGPDVPPAEGCADVTFHYLDGPHPAGNIGTQVAAISSINKGECIWTMLAQDVVTLGHWLLTGQYRPERVIAAAGPAARSPHYYRLLAGACIGQIAAAQLTDPGYPTLPSTRASFPTRVISGSVLSGTTVGPDGFLGMYDQQLSFVEEGDRHEFMGWLMPGLHKHSFSRTFLSGFLRTARRHDSGPARPQDDITTGRQDNGAGSSSRSLADWLSPRYTFSTNTHGSVRPFLFSGQFEQVFPFDIYPLQLIKACIVGDIELQEQLGIYEVEPEDFALCEYIDPSKTDIQTIIRNALEVLRKEATA